MRATASRFSRQITKRLAGRCSSAPLPPLNICRVVNETLNEYVNDYQTVSTTEGIFAQGSSSLSLKTPNITLVQIGPFNVQANLTGGFSSGKITWGNDSGAQDGIVANVNDTLNWGSGNFLAARNGWGTVNPATQIQYHDGPWYYNADIGNYYTMFVDGNTDPTWSASPVRAYQGPGWTWSPVDERAHEDSDKSLQVDTSATLGIGLQAGVGVSYGGWSIGISAGGSINGALHSIDMVRDGEYATRASSDAGVAQGVDGVTIRPRDESNVNLVPISIGITFKSPKLPLIGSISFTETIYSAPALTLSSSDSDSANSRGMYSEANYLRIGTGGAEATDTSTSDYGWSEQPSVMSHLPNGEGTGSYTSSTAEFPSFPASIDSCLADTSALPAPAATPGPTQTSMPAPIQADMCFTLGDDFTGPGCAVAASTGSTPAIACRNAWRQFVCGLPTVYNSGTHSDAVFDPTNATEVANLTTATTACMTAYQNASQTASAATSELEHLMKVTACSSAGVPLASTPVTLN